MKKKEPVSTIMTRHAYTVQLTDSLYQVRDLILKHEIRHVPVMEGDKLVGIVSRTDINRMSFSGLFAGEGQADEAIFEMLTIAQVMSQKPRVVKAIGYKQKLPSLQPLAVDGYDLVDTEILFENGGVCHIITGWAIPNSAHAITVQSARIIGSEGMISTGTTPSIVIR